VEEVEEVKEVKEVKEQKESGDATTHCASFRSIDCLHDFRKQNEIVVLA
jgi:hypothetical protein